MSFKNKLLQIYAKYDLNPTSLSRKLGYAKSEKISRLTRDENNMPGYDIIRDIIATFPDVNPRWWFSIDEEMIVNEDHQHYGICKECLKKDGKIELLLEELMKRDKIIAELRKKIPDVSGQESQAAS